MIKIEASKKFYTKWLIILGIIFSITALPVSLNAEQHSFIAKYDRYQVNTNKESTDNLLAALQFNIKIPKKDIYKNLKITIKNGNDSKIFKFDNGKADKYHTHAFMQNDYTEYSWIRCDMFTCNVSVQFYPEYYITNFKPTKSFFVIKVTEDRFKFTKSFDIDTKLYFSKEAKKNIKNKNLFNVEIVDKKDKYIFINKKKNTFDPNSEYNHIVEYRIKGDFIKEKITFNEDKIKNSYKILADLPVTIDELDYLSVFIYDSENRYENKIVLIDE